MKNLLLIVLMFTGSFCVYAQEVSAVTDKNAILIGEQLQLQLKASFKKNQKPAWFASDSIPRFEILSSSKIDTLQTDEATVLSQELVITSWDSGTLYIPSFQLKNKRTDRIAVEVSYTKMDPNKDYHDIKTIIPVNRPRESQWYWYLILAAVLVALFLLFFPAAKNKEEKKEQLPENAYEDAVRKLHRLEAERAIDNKSFYTELVHIFREYLHRKKNIQSFSKTTDDLAIQITSLNLPTEQYNELVQSLQVSDMVKFAKYQPQESEKEQAIKTIKENIDTIEKQPNAV